MCHLLMCAHFYSCPTVSLIGKGLKQTIEYMSMLITSEISLSFVSYGYILTLVHWIMINHSGFMWLARQSTIWAHEVSLFLASTQCLPISWLPRQSGQSLPSFECSQTLGLDEKKTVVRDYLWCNTNSSCFEHMWHNSPRVSSGSQ